MSAPPLAMAAAGVVLLVAVVAIVVVLVVYLVGVILALAKITRGLDEVIAGVGEILEKTAPVNEIVMAINGQLDAGVDALEALLVKKAGIVDAVGLIDGLYAGAAAGGFRNFADSAAVTAPRIAEVYTRGTLTLARLGREAPIAAANPGAVLLRDVRSGSLAARALYPEIRQSHPQRMPRSPVIGAGAPVQYEQRDDIGQPRKRMPASATANSAGDGANEDA